MGGTTSARPTWAARMFLITQQVRRTWPAGRPVSPPGEGTLRPAGRLYPQPSGCLWERWNKAPNRVPVECCAIITTGANQLLRRLHDRMPVILAPDDYPEWLGED